ncbi:hypothetical protein LCGC14_3006190, partial [marine sediment metagenome]
IQVFNALRDGLPIYNTGFTALQDMAEGFSINEDNLKGLQTQLGFTDREMLALINDFENQAAAAGGFEIALIALDRETKNLETSARAAAAGLGDTSETLSAFERNMGRTRDTTVQAATAAGGYVLPLNLVRDALEEAETANRSLADAMLEMTNPTFKAVKAVEALDTAEENLEKVRKKAGKRVTVEEARAIAKAELAVFEATVKAQIALDAFAFDPANLEATIQGLVVTMGKSRDEVLLMLQALGVLDGTQVRMLLELTTSVTGPLKGLLGGGALSDFELRVGTRALGGPVTAGDPFLVGERGTELFVPDRSGTIIPNNVLNQSSSRSVVVEINGAVFGSDVDVQAAVQAGLIAGGVTESVEWAG